MPVSPDASFVAFEDHRLLAQGTRAEVADAVAPRVGSRPCPDGCSRSTTATGAQVDFDPREDIAAGGRNRPARARATETRRRGAGSHAVAAPLGLARRPARRRFGRSAPPRRRGAPDRWRGDPGATDAGRGLQISSRDRGRPSRLRGSFPRALCRRHPGFRGRGLRHGRATSRISRADALAEADERR